MYTGIIYKYTSPSNKVYVGQTINEYNRKNAFKNIKHLYAGGKIDKARLKYGPDNFQYEDLETIEKDSKKELLETLNNLEVQYITKYDSFKSGYNSTPGGDEKTIYKIDDVNDIINRLQAGEMIKNIANDYDVCPHTIRRTLQAYGINTPSDIQGKRIREDLRTIPREKIRELYTKGLSHSEIAKELDIDQRSVSRVVKELGIGKRNMIDYNSLDLDAVLIDFNKVESGELKKKDVLKKYGLNQHSLKVIKKLKNIS